MHRPAPSPYMEFAASVARAQAAAAEYDRAAAAVARCPSPANVCAALRALTRADVARASIAEPQPGFEANPAHN